MEAEVTAIKRQAEQAGRELQRRLQEESDREVCWPQVYFVCASNKYVCSVFSIIHVLVTQLSHPM